MIKINVNVFPSGSGGHVFTESDGTVIRGKSWSGVVRKVQAYRRQNGLEPGNAYDEVMAQACARNPSLCKEVTAAPPAAVRPPTLKGRVITWLATLRAAAQRQSLAYAAKEVMKARANTCAACPFSKPLPEGCSTCKMAITEMRKQILGPERLNGLDHRPGACEALGCDLPTAAWLDEPRVRHDGLPAHCWRKAQV